MAEESTPEASGTENAAPAKASKFGKLQIFLLLQLVAMLAAGGLIVKATLFTKRVTFTKVALREKAIESVRDDPAAVSFVDLETFTLAVGGRNLKAQIQLELSNPDVANAITARKAAIKAKVLDVLTAQDAKEFGTLQGKLLVKDAIRDAINEEILSLHKEGRAPAGAKGPPGIVRDVYFAELVFI